MKYFNTVSVGMVLALAGGATTGQEPAQNHSALFIALGVGILAGAIISSSGGGNNNTHCIEPIVVNGGAGGTPSVCK